MSMNALSYASSISDAKDEINRDYENGNMSEDERNWRFNHVIGF